MREKKELIDEIKKLIAINGETVAINSKYLEYFELEELEDIKEELISKKQNIKNSTKEYVEELYEKFSE
jgi:hypothetical protein